MTVMSRHCIGLTYVMPYVGRCNQKFDLIFKFNTRIFPLYIDQVSSPFIKVK